MILPDGEELITIERPWANNLPNISCIPIGTYPCSPRRYFAGEYDAIQVESVPGRSMILFHIGNFVRDSQGCILVNSRYTYTKNGMRGNDSAIAFKKFMGFYGGKNFDLKIVNYEGGLL